MREKIIGILGGMGPEATAELFYRIIKTTPAKKDQDHLRIIVFNNPKIPDRTDAIAADGTSPLDEMVKTARNLEEAGADFIIMPCNAAHHYYDGLKKSINIPILDMIELTVSMIEKKYPIVRSAGVIATNGTVKSRIYEKALRKIGVNVVYPTKELEEAVMESIYGNIKVGHIRNGRKILLPVASYLAQESDLIVIGCTEASLALKNIDLAVPIIDPLQILADAAVKTALGYKI